MRPDDERELDELAERLDAAFAATRPRPGFEQELRGRIGTRRRSAPWWDRVGLGPLAGAAAALLLVAGFGYLLLHAGPGGTGRAGSSAARPLEHGAAPAVVTFGTLPRPAVAPAPSAAAGGTDQVAPAPAGLPGSAPVYRYAEPPPADADGFASGHGAHPLTVAPSGARLYQGDGFALTVLPTNAPQGLEPAFVLTPQGREPEGSGPQAAAAEAAAQRFLDQYRLSAPQPARVEATVAAGVPTVVRYVPQLNGADLVTTAGTPAGLAVVVKADGGVFQASGPLPLALQSALYPLASYDQLARAAGPGYDRAALVYVLAFDGRYGYLEPALLFSGPRGRLVVPAVSPSSLR